MAPQEYVLKVLELANFHKMMPIAATEQEAGMKPALVLKCKAREIMTMDWVTGLCGLVIGGLGTLLLTQADCQEEKRRSQPLCTPPRN